MFVTLPGLRRTPSVSTVNSGDDRDEGDVDAALTQVAGDQAEQVGWSGGFWAGAVGAGARAGSGVWGTVWVMR